ncbi:Chitotriosidase-1 [Folsomia candida]|uniref:Chitotriosidase-1 n=1 Tax=Folsomia candida TaxID=158441 RepID=A0A226DP00_FOLCA|nr:Chitotriosidase-1 [Folsomia candida]
MPFEPSNIDPSLCTHVIYPYMGMTEDNFNIYSRNPPLDYGPGEVEPYPDDPEVDQGEFDMIRKTANLKGDNPALKTMASIGGPLQSSRSFSNMARHVANRTLFLKSVTNFPDTYNLDGIDDLRAAFTNLTAFTGKNYTLTAGLGCTGDIIDIGYDVPKLAE